MNNNAFHAQDKLSRVLFATLTPQECFVAVKIFHSVPHKCIADEMGITVRTVRFHLENIAGKTGCRTPQEIALLVERANRDSLPISAAILVNVNVGIYLQNLKLRSRKK